MTDFDIFKSCFPEYNLTEELFTELSGKANCRIFCEEGGTAFVNRNKLAFIAVAPEYRNNGIGGRLLAQCEEYVRERGSEYLYVGGIFPGLPEKNHDYFVKRGYETQGSFAEMGMDVTGFTADKAHAPEGVSFSFFRGEHSDLLEAVAEVDEEWVQYFIDDSKVFCGFKNGEIASFCIVDESVSCLMSDGNIKVGSIGCVGTRPVFRCQGAGLYMVELATEYLARKDCDKSFIHCTHLESWYGKLGYRTFLRYGAARKKL